MRIEHFSYHNKTLDWKVETTFFPNLSLLVGISGVGKTQILNAVWLVKEIANGRPSDGAKWDITFVATNGTRYFWSGEYESSSTSEDDDSFLRIIRGDENEGVKLRILSEKLSIDGQDIVQRNASDIFFGGNKTPKLSPFESVLSILNQEEDIAPAYQSFKSIIRSDFSGDISHRLEVGQEVLEYNKALKSQPTLDQIQRSSLVSSLKIALVYYCVPEVFSQIKERFMDIFPQVEDISFESVNFCFEFLKATNLDPNLENYPLLRIKEKGVKSWIRQERISSGMYKTFMHISEMFLWPEGTVILIDEFENSLGVNCIDVLTEDLIQDRLQFIITSHHPYIINSINPRYWKIVTRAGGVVTTHDASELEISSSRHQAFIQLINKEEFKEGIGV